MERKIKERYEPFNFGSNRGQIHPLRNTRDIGRNEPCPCGKTKIVSYPGTEFPDRVVPIKFKNCCLSELGPKSDTVKSTAEIINERNQKRFAV